MSRAHAWPHLLLVVAIVFLAASPIRVTAASAVLISDTAMSVMVELSSRHPFCRMHTDRGDIQRMLLQSDQRRIRQVPRDSVMELEDVCQKSGSYGYEFRGGLGFIYPGTKWCGPGNVAANYNDLGPHAEEDRCCREHDLCPNVLNVGECRRGLCNTGTFTRSHCDCDARLRRCLQSVNSETANTLGAIFYNVVQVTCFQERSPCSAHQRFGADFYYKTHQCALEFRPAELYIPPSRDNLIRKIVTQPLGFTAALPFSPPQPLPPQPLPGRHYAARSLRGERQPHSDQPTFAQQFNHFSRRLSVRLASFGLAAVNIFREIIRSPRVIWENLVGGGEGEKGREGLKFIGREHVTNALDDGYILSKGGGRGNPNDYDYRSSASEDMFWKG